MNNVNMAAMNAMGGPVGGGMPTMNNGAGPGARQPMPGNDNRSQLNTYIYEYFLRNEMYDCARSLKSSNQPINLFKDSPGRGGDETGSSGAGDDGGDGDSKDDMNSSRPSDLPAPNLPKDTPESCFLYEWWCLFWDMFNAQRGKGEGRNVLQYVTHTQAQSRMRQDQQQAMLRGLRGGNAGDMSYNMMARGQQNGMNNELRQKAIQNNRNAPNMQMLAQQQKQQQMQRDPSNQDNQQRPQSPGSAENAPSPSKRPRLDGSSFNPQQMPNGRGQSQGMPQQVGDTGPGNAIQAAHMQLTNGIEPNNLTAQQFQNMPGGGNNQARTVAGYQATLAQQQQSQMPGAKGAMPNPGGPQNQGSPMMGQGQDGGVAIANYYNPGEMGPNGLRGAPGGQPGQTGGNHALQDYQMQLMLLEQQNKKRLMMARQEQDNGGMTVTRPDGSQGPGGPGQMGPNGQPYQGTSPQGPRSVNSPNPGDQMKRGTPHMGPAGMPSPLPEGQSRGSPSSGMNFNLPGGPMDPNMNPQYFAKMNGMDPNMVGGGMPNGMRPPSSHPGGGFPQQMTPQQIAMARQAQQQAAQGWQPGPNGQMMPQPNPGAPQQAMGTPQQRAMPPPSAPATGAAANGRTQPSSPQQGAAAPPTPQQTNKGNPKKKAESKDSKAKRAAAKKGSAANLNSGATPSADAETAGATPAAPATPITPVHPKFNGQNGAAQPATNGQPPAQPANVVPQQADLFQGGFGGADGFGGFDSGGLVYNADISNGADVLGEFDFDSFLNQDGDAGETFSFDASAFLDDGIGAD